MIDNFNNEQWRDIDGYDGMYQVSDLGRVRSLKYGKVRVLRPGKTKYGYLRVDLYRNGKHNHSFVHRLVAQAFIENDDDSKTVINHIDECKQNNRVDNLEYCTQQYNVTYNNVNWRRKNGKRRKISKLYNPDLSIADNLEIFKANGIECSERTVRKLRNDIGLTKHPVRKTIKDLYDPNLSIKRNLEIFRANGVECSKYTVIRLRKELGLTRKHKPYRQIKSKQIE